MSKRSIDTHDPNANDSTPPGSIQYHPLREEVIDSLDIWMKPDLDKRHVPSPTAGVRRTRCTTEYTTPQQHNTLLRRQSQTR